MRHYPGKRPLIRAICLVFFLLQTAASVHAEATPTMQQADHRHHNMRLTSSGMVMNNNTLKLPQDCAQLGPDIEFTVYAGTEFAADYPGTVFGMSPHEYLVAPCSRITITFTNKDEVRHHWMIHGLPRYLYPGGMFTIAAAGGHTQTGTFIVPGDDKTYLVHCDMAQHMEKGMKAQLKVGKGSGDLWSIPGISSGFIRDSYLPGQTWLYVFLSALAGIMLATLVTVGRRRR